MNAMSNPLVRGSVRLLVVEDNPGDAQLLELRLGQVEQPRFETRIVETLRGALQALTDDDYDAVLLDLGLPDSNGIETVGALVGAHPTIAVVVLTGWDDDDLGTAAVRGGAQDFLVKGRFDGPGAARSILFAIERAHVKEQVRRIVERNVDAMLVVGEDQVVRFANRSAAELFGNELSALIGSTFEHVYEDGRAREIRLDRTEDGTPRVAELRFARVEWDNQTASLVSIRDITEIKRAQELERRLLHADRLAAVGRLAAGVAHEVNNPATFVLTNLELVRDRIAELEGIEDHDELLEMLQHSMIGVEQIAAIVKELAEFSRLDRAGVELVDLNEVVDDAIAMTQNQIRYRAQLVRETEDVPKIAADRSRLGQVLVNLIINAAHATEERPAAHHRIEVTTRHREGELVLSVRDTGCGIPGASLERLFDPFYTTKPRTRGTGLGLSISSEIVRRHGGRIEVESEVGVGSNFRVILPEQTGLELTPLRKTTPIPQSEHGGSGRILLIDDDALVRMALRRILRPSHDVAEARDGAAALAEIAKTDEFDLILCDMMMPGVDGPAFYEALAEQAPHLQSRVVFLTGGAFTTRGREFLKDHQGPVLEKPVKRMALRELVAAFVHARAETPPEA